MKKAYVFNYETELYDLVYIKTRSVGATVIDLNILYDGMPKLEFKNLPPKTKEAIRQEYTEMGVAGTCYPIKVWIAVLKIKNKYTEDIQLELFPYIYGDKSDQ